MKPNKVCPVLLRIEGNSVSILAFRHPTAGNQLVKGGIEPDESHEDAALRELREESGIESAVIDSHLGVWVSGHDEQIWTVYLCEARGLRETWVHHASDDGGTDFTFFWHTLDGLLSEEWHPLFREAVKWIGQRVRPG